MLVTRPDEPPGYQLLVAIESQRGRLDLAIPHAVDQSRVNPDSYGEYHQLATLFALLDDQESALDWYQRTPPGIQTSDYIPGLLYWTEEEVHRVEAQFERDVALYEGWDSGQRSYVTALFLNRKLEEGVGTAALYEDAYQTSPSGVTPAVAGPLAKRQGQAELGERLLAFARSRNERMRAAGFREAAVHYTDAVLAVAEVEHDAVFEALAAFRSVGGLNIRSFLLHPIWDPLREDPRFDAFMIGFAADLAAQRSRLADQGL